MNGWPTTRRYPRSLREAFPQDHAESVQHYTPRFSWLRKTAEVVVTLTLFGLIGAMLAQGV